MKKRFKIILGVIGSLIVLPIVLVIIFLFIIPIDIDDWDVSEKFGNNYVLVGMSSKLYPILYQYQRNNKSFDLLVVYENIIECNYNDQWIIAKSSKQNYWLIDKTVPINQNDSINIHRNVKAGLIGPLDSLSFYKILEEKDIGLKLRKRKN